MQQRRAWLLKSEALKKKRNTLVQDDRKTGLRACQESARNHPLEAQSCRRKRIHFVNRALFESGCPGYLLSRMWLTVLSYPGTQRPGNHDAKGPGYCWSQWQILVVPIFTSMKKSGVVGSERLLLRFQKKPWEARHCAPESAGHKTVKAKSRVQQRPQNTVEVRNMVHLSKATKTKQSQPKRKAMRVVATSSDRGVGLRQPCGVHILAWLGQVLDLGLQDLMFALLVSILL